ncbi:hypothetical protein LTR66_004499 [Elasticomyces elasticus]|nr:hypothetical protein LTR66_004499 [Elasticomyces elasticus]
MSTLPGTTIAVLKGALQVTIVRLHPNALGEYQIAQAFSRTLHDDFKFGTGALQVPGNFPDRDVSVPSNIAAAPEDMGVRVTWNAVYGVFSYSVRYRFSESSDWQVVQVSTNRYDHTYTVGGIQWEFQVRSEYGDTKQGGTAGLWSGSVSATAQRNTPPPPNDIRSSPTFDGLQVTWGSVNGSFNVDRFVVIIWDRDTPGASIDMHAVRQSPFRAIGLNVGHHYDIFVETWAGPGEGGLPGIPPSIVVGGGLPATPSNLQAVNQDPTTVQLTWNAVPGAAGYRIYASQDQFAGGHQDRSGTVVVTNSYGIYFMFPGTWHYRICVSALNGNLESAQTCVTPPVAPGS